MLMLRLKKQLQLTSVVVTHDLDLLNRVADTVVFIEQRPGGLLLALSRTCTNQAIPISRSFWNSIK